MTRAALLRPKEPEPRGWPWLERLRARVRARWGARAKKLMLGQAFFLWGLAQALPADVLDQLPMLRHVTGPVVSAIPSAASFVARSDFPQVAEVILCIGWLLAVPNLLFGLLLPEHMQKSRPPRVFGELMDIKPPETGSMAFYLAGMFLLVLIPALTWMILTVPIFDPKYGVDDDYVFGGYTLRIGFGLAAQAVSNFVGFTLATWAVVAGHCAGSFLAFLRRTGDEEVPDVDT